MRVRGQVSPLRQVLPKQTIGVLIGTTLPRTLRIAEVNVDVGRQRQAPMVRKLLAAVPGIAAGAAANRSHAREPKFCGRVAPNEVASSTGNSGMPTNEAAWRARWNEAIERVIAASAARDREKPGTPTWEEADADYEAALATYRETAAELK